MYAVIKTGGKQYKVSEGDLLKVEKIEGAVGDAIERRSWSRTRTRKSWSSIPKGARAIARLMDTVSPSPA
jgi:hypothetical protein